MAKLKGDFNKAILEVGFPGAEVEEVSAPVSAELGKDTSDDDAIFDRTEVVCSDAGVRVFDCQDPVQAKDWAELEVKFQNVKKPKKPSDPPAYVRTKTVDTFTKDGMYLVAVHWVVYTCIAVKDTFEGEVTDEPKPKSV